MAFSIPTALPKLASPLPPLPPPLRFLSLLKALPSSPISKTLGHSSRSTLPRMLPPPRALSLQDLPGAGAILDIVRASPPTWKSAFASNVLIFLAGSPILVSGLSASGIAAAFLLGILTWRAFGPSGFLLVAAYFVMGTAATKLKITQKEALGVAEKRRGRRGPGSVIGSSAAGCVCAFLSIYHIGGATYAGLWQLGFVASFCTKLSDTVSSEIGKAYGKITYLVTTLKVVPKGTEGAISVEGTIAGIVAAVLLAGAGYLIGKVNVAQAVICVLASQIANFGESLIGAELQGKEGFRWLNNDAVNVINISIGSLVAVLMQKLIIESWRQ